MRTAHGRAAKLGTLAVIETCPPDELPAGIAGPARPEAERQGRGEFAPGAGTSAVARLGGLAAAETRKFARLLGLVDFDESHPYAPYMRLAREHREDHGADLAAHVGGGRISAGVSSILASASLALAASRFLYDRGALAGDPLLLGQAARLADQSRTSLLTAHELAAREAVDRRSQQSAADRVAARITPKAAKS
ncbi:MAG TPA: hypothetical protein VGI10_04385 [Polyangiaceae bacterium]